MDASSVLFLGAAKSLGVDFTRTAMIGRQSLWSGEKPLRRVFAQHGIGLDAGTFLRDHAYAEEFFRQLGAQEVVSFDASPYESATVVHDMNLAVPEAFHRRFSCVYDGGTIEHVFNAPQAFKNCMEMVEVGGHFAQVNVANNFSGHGFWQFSPELIFRLFSPANGFQIVTVLLREVVPNGPWYVANDPNRLRQSIRLCNHRPTYILTIAKRISGDAVLSAYPQQSNYETLWQEAEGPSGHAPAAASPARPRRLTLANWRSFVPTGVKRVYARVCTRRARRWPGYASFSRGFCRRGFRRIGEAALLRGDCRS